MAKTYLVLQPSEQIVVSAASQIYAAYIASGQVTQGEEQEWMDRSIKEAIRIAKVTDATIVCDDEMD